MLILLKRLEIFIPSHYSLSQIVVDIIVKDFPGHFFKYIFELLNIKKF